MDRPNLSFREAWRRPFEDRGQAAFLFAAAATVLFMGLYFYWSIAWPGILESRRSGWGLAIVGGHPVVTAIREKDEKGRPLPAFKAGVQTGDVILADFSLHMDPLHLRGYQDHLTVMKTVRPGEPWGMVLERSLGEGRTETLRVLVEPPPKPHPALWWGRLLYHHVIPIFAVFTGLFIGFARPRDRNALTASLLFLSLGLFFIPGEYPWVSGLRNFCIVFHRYLWLLLPFFAVLFFLRFPAPSPIEKRLPWLKYAILGYFLAWASLWTVNSYLVYTDYEAFSLWQNAIAPLWPANEWIWTAVFLLAALSLIFNTVRAKSSEDRRRLIILQFGLVFGFLPFLVYYIFYEMHDQFTLVLGVLFLASLLLFPLSFMYVVLVHHVFGVRVILRRGLQYALLSRGFLVVEGALLFLVLYLVAGPVLTYYWPGAGPGVMAVTAALVTGAAMFGIQRLNRRVMPAIDRRFFREAYDARRILTDLGSAVRSMAREPDRLVRRVSLEVMGSLHPRSVEVFLRGAEKEKLRLVAGTGLHPLRDCGRVPKDSYSCCYRLVRPPGKACDTFKEGNVENLALPPGMRVEQELTRSISGELRTVDVYLDNPHSWTRLLPEGTEGDQASTERYLLKSLGTRLLVPLAVQNRLIGFLSLGEKLSEEPYSREDRGLLLAVAQQTAVALDYACLIGEVADQSRIQRDVEIAAEVQNRLFPQEYPKVRTLDYAGVCKPAQGVGGDYYDFIPVGIGKLGIALGDVSGKGISAALIMANLQANLRSQAAYRGVRVGDLLEEINRLLCVSTDCSKFATLFYGVYDDEARSLTYVNAGHLPPILFRGGRPLGRAEGLRSTGGVLGIFEDSRFKKDLVRLLPGDILVIYSDGATDAFDPSGESFEEERLCGCVLQNAHLPAVEILNRTMAEIIRFQGAALQFDDITLVVAKVH